MVEELQPERSLNHMPFTTVMFVLQSSSLDQSQMADLQVELQQVTSDLAKFELTLALKETERGLLAQVEYNRDLFDEPFIQRLFGHYETLLRSVVLDPKQRISQLPLLTPQERHQLLTQWNDTKTTYPIDSCVHHLFEEQAARKPRALAIQYGPKTLTYGELNVRANQLAHYLKRFQIGPDTRVGVCLERSIDLVISFLAIVKAGAAYVPLDPDYPQERLEFMLNDTGLSVVLTQENLLPRVPAGTDWKSTRLN